MSFVLILKLFISSCCFLDHSGLVQALNETFFLLDQNNSSPYQSTLGTVVQQLNRPELISVYYEQASAQLSETLHQHPEVEWPLFIDTDQYIYNPPAQYQYFLNLIVDPCRGFDPYCCWDKYGVPEYADIVPTNLDRSGAVQTVDETSESIPSANSRLPVQYIVYDSNCRSDAHGNAYRIVETPSNGTNSSVSTFYDYKDPYCMGNYEAMADKIILPPCWDNNSTVDANLSCLTTNGMSFPNCVAFGYTSTAYIVQCGKSFIESNHCGTFIELHFPGQNEILSQTRLEGGFTSGYRTSIIPLIFQGDPTKIICKGNYELWWVQRTLYNFIIQLKKKIFVQNPDCTFDFEKDIYYRYYFQT